MSEPAAVALETLREHCSPEQRASLDATRTFAAIGASGKRYIIFVVGDTVTVTFENTRRKESDFAPVNPTWTAYVRGRYKHLPPADCALLAKLSIEAHEEHWKAMAYMCGNVYVEDMTPAQEARERTIAAAFQQVVVEQQRFTELAQAGQLAVGTVWNHPNGRYQWDGRQWILQP